LEALQLFAGYAGLALKNAQWNDDLEQRVQQRTLELQTANNEIESLSYTIAHDMRSPLRAMVGYSQMLVETHKAQLDEIGRTDLERIHHEAKRMGQLVDDFLTFLRIARRPMNKRLTDMTNMIARVWEQLRPQRAGREIAFHIGAMLPAQVNPELIEEVWMQFITNALKFTRPRAQVSIEIGNIHFPGPDGNKTASENPVYFIRDNGIGFDMRFADKLFSIFQRLNRQEDFEGTGIGLAIAQRIIHKHGGRIWAEAEVDKGATFYFTLG
jgi:light-regulated signal transduction histidine kinase (bacteriophytochrome)